MHASVQEAARRHTTLGQLLGSNATLAEALWLAVTSAPVSTLAVPYAEAVRDTTPEEFATLLATDEVAAAYAFAEHQREHDSLRRFDSGTTKGPSPFELRERARVAWQRFADRASAANDVAEGLGWDLSDAWRTEREAGDLGVSMHEVREIAKLAGRMYASLRGSTAARMPATPEEVYDVECGGDVGRIVSSELVALCDDDRELSLMAKIVNRTAIQYKLRGHDTTAKGPLTICLDESASMHASRNRWAKAVALACARICHEDHRPMAVVHYSTSVWSHVVARGDSGALLTMIKSFMSGGTNIPMAIEESARQVDALARKGSKGCDVILVTDGLDPSYEALDHAIDELDRTSAKLWLVGIECNIPAESPIRARATSYTCLSGGDLGRGDSAVAIGGAL